jgi:hypothetical protein
VQLGSLGRAKVVRGVQCFVIDRHAFSAQLGGVGLVEMLHHLGALGRIAAQRQQFISGQPIWSAP